jgi:hypothetical protein
MEKNLTVALTAAQIQYLWDVSLYHMRSNCLAWDVDGPEMQEHLEIRGLLGAALR